MGLVGPIRLYSGLFRDSWVYSGLFRPIRVYFRSIQAYYGIIQVYSGLFGTMNFKWGTQDYAGLIRTSQDCSRLFRPVQHCSCLYGIFYDYSGLFGIVVDYSVICMCICVEPERMPPRTITMFVGFQTEIYVKPRASHKQNYDQGGFPSAELRPGRLSTSRITNRELTYPQAELRPGSLLAMRNYVCALLGAVLARVVFALLLSLRRSVQFFLIAVLLFLFATGFYCVLCIHTCIFT